MKATFYLIKDFNNSLNRDVGNGTEIPIIIKNNSFNILRPNLLISLKYNTKFFPFNYVYFPDFKRYYFITDVTIVSSGLINISCKVDVLKTYADTIKNSSVLITKSTDYNKFVNSGYESTVQKEIESLDLPITLNEKGVNILLANQGDIK